MPNEYWTINDSCKSEICFFKKIDDLKGKTRFKCYSSSCFKIVTLGEEQKEVKAFNLTKVVSKNKPVIKLKF